MSCGAASDGLGSIAPCQLGTGCAQAQPGRVTALVTKLDAATLSANGLVVQPDLRGLPSRVGNKHAHVVGILIDGSFKVVIGDTTNAAVPLYAAMAAFGQIFLEDSSGHQYAAGIDGRDVQDDRWYRNRAFSQGDPGSVIDGGAANATWVKANVGAASTITQPLSLYWQLSRMGYEGYGVDGAIPLAALQKRGIGALRWTAGIPQGTYTNVSFNTGDAGFFGTVRVWFEIVYTDAYFADAQWQLENYTLAEVSGSLRHGDRVHEYAILRHRPEDTGGQALTDYDGVTIQVNGQTTNSAMTLYEFETREHMLTRNTMHGTLFTLYPGASTGQTNASASIDFSKFNYSLSLVPYMDRMSQPSGLIQFSFATRSTHTLSRFLHRTIKCHTDQAITDVVRAGLGGCGTPIDKKTTSVVGVDSAGRAVPVHPRLPIAFALNTTQILLGGNVVRPVTTTKADGTQTMW